RRARRAKFGRARPCRVATLGKGREASGARPQPETARERTRMYVTEPETARTKRRAAYRPAPLIPPPGSPSRLRLGVAAGGVGGAAPGKDRLCLAQTRVIINFSSKSNRRLLKLMLNRHLITCSLA